VCCDLKTFLKFAQALRSAEGFFIASFFQHTEQIWISPPHKLQFAPVGDLPAIKSVFHREVWWRQGKGFMTIRAAPLCSNRGLNL
jgi:hypothetical protein